MLRGRAAGAARQYVGVLLSQGSHASGAVQQGKTLDSRLWIDFGAVASGLARKFTSSGLRRTGAGENWVESQIGAFKRGVPVEEAATPPSSWYTSPEIHNLELEKVFERRWLPVGRTEQLQSPGDFFTGKVGRVRYLVCKDEQGTVRAFHNVCRHHAAAVAAGSGCATSFVCPYHAWTYALDGKLLKASRLGGIKDFSAKKNGLSPLSAGTWGPFVLVSLPRKEGNSPKKLEARELLGSVAKTYFIEKEWLGSAAKALTEAKIDSTLRYVTTREYTLNCNWKVFCDNYLDGGYHVPYAHPNLASDLNLKSYSTTLSEKVSIQRCRSAKTGTGDKRVGEFATFAFVYPNFMINRYGPWMDTNLVLPITETQCRVIFDYYLEASYPHDECFIKESLECSDVVQQEDIGLCEGVQEGLQSPAYDVGRYAPNVEYAMHHFHSLLHEDLSGDSEDMSGLDTQDLKQALLRHPLT